MKLRTYIFLISTFIMAALILVFSIQSQRVLRSSVNELNSTYISNVGNVIASLIRGKSSYIKQFGKLLESDNDMSGAFVIAKESTDFHLIVDKLEQMKSHTDFDIVDILFTDGHALKNEALSMNKDLASYIVKERHGIIAFGSGSDLTLLGITPLKMCDEVVGYSLLGYQLNPMISKRMQSLAKADFKLSLPEERPKADGSFTNAMDLFGTNGKPVYLSIDLKRSFIDDISRVTLRDILWCGGLCFLVVAGLIWMLIHLGFVRQFEAILRSIDGAVQSLSSGKLPSLKLKRQRIKEMNLLSESFNRLAESLHTYDSAMKEQSKMAAENQKQAALSEMTRTVAHNVRDKLFVLDTVIGDLESVPDEKRRLMRDAIGSIGAFLDKLRNQNRLEDKDISFTDKTELSLQLLPAVVQEVVMEKYATLKDNTRVQLLNEVGVKHYGIFVNVSVNEFKAALSNLINNSMEAMEKPGTITILANVTADWVKIQVQDTGIGIPDHILPQLCKKNATFGKTTGSGLGLYHAKTVLNAWGGDLSISSEEGKGTVVEIRLPRAEQPAWFMSEIQIPENGRVIILDDELSIHEAWGDRFDILEARKRNIELVHFSSGEEMLNWANTDFDDRPSIYFCDYELRGEHVTGLDVIKILGIEQHSVLVTGGHDDETIRQTCISMHVPLIPKGLARFVPIRFVTVVGRKVSG